VGALLAGAPVAAAQAASPAVSVFPIPGAMVAAPQTQITFRGVPASRIGSIEVWGTQSGVHAGQIVADSDGNGGSFVPSTPFTPGETVWVKTSLHIIGTAHPGTWRFTVASPSGNYPQGCNIWAPRVAGDVWTFKSRPDLSPAAVKILRRWG